MHTKLIVITGIVISQPAWADLTPKSHIGFAGIDFQGKVAVIMVIMITFLISHIAAMLLVPRFRAQRLY